jgi:hypothetical protein
MRVVTKGLTKELLSKTQAHLEAVRSKLAKKEQQYQQVRRVRYGDDHFFTLKYMHSKQCTQMHF